MALNIYKKTKPGSTVALDTMCFIYHFEGNPAYQEVSTAAFQEAFAKDLNLVTSTITLTELSGYAVAGGEQPQPKLYRSLLGNVPRLKMINVDTDLAEVAGQLKGRYKLKSPDALQLATALLSGAAVFLTNDKKLRRVKETKVLVLSDFL